MSDGVRMRITRAYEVGGLLYVDGVGMAGQSLKKVLVNEQHGMASTPPLGAIGYVTMPGGRPDLAYLGHIQHPGYRPSVPAGAAVLYNQFGQLIRMYQDEVTIEAGSTLRLNAASVEITSGSLTHNGVNIGASHVHGGVIPGAGDTGAPE